MTASAYGVIGAGYCDEGKGRTVDAIAARLGPETVVVRSNGGSQAGHTVVTPDGRRHVFHHLGSGALAGAATHLSRLMVSHPMMLRDERRSVAALGGSVTITADPRGFVTTPWDMMVNQAIEAARGGARHGSCGLGFGETVGRNEETAFRLAAADLAARGLRDRLIAIRDEWLPARLASLGIDNAGEGFLVFAASDAVLERFLDDCVAFAATVTLRHDETLADASHLIFEAAQGLMLDQHHRDFPFVTRSNTGIANMIALAEGAGIARIDAFYATRCYLTRHGRGPMIDERDLRGLFAVDDPTNRPNPWQETLRTGLLDHAALAATVAADLEKAANGTVEVEPHLAVSCLDQAVDGVVAHLDGGDREYCPAAAFPECLRERVGAASVEGWWGAARNANRPRPTEMIDGLWR